MAVYLHTPFCRPLFNGYEPQEQTTLSPLASMGRILLKYEGEAMEF